MLYKLSGINIPVLQSRDPFGKVSAISSGSINQLNSYVLAFARAAANGSNNASHALRLEQEVEKCEATISCGFHVRNLIWQTVPYTSPRLYVLPRLRTRTNGRPWPRNFHARFWMDTYCDPDSEYNFYWFGEFRTPGDFDPNHLGSIPCNSMVALKINESNRKVELAITSRNEESVYRRMAAAYGDLIDVPCGYEIARELVRPPERYLWMEHASNTV